MLVIQFDATTPRDFDRYIAVEEIIREKLVDESTVDGHDFGIGEFNIFLFTFDPKTTLENICRILSENALSLRAGFRRLDSDSYEPLWPEGLHRFSVA